MSRGTTAIVDFENLRHNFQVLSKLAPGKLVLVVKADAYGHGLKKIVQALDGVDCFAVATIDEALIVRQVRPKARVLLLEGFLDNDELLVAIQNQFDSVIHQKEQFDMFLKLEPNESMNIWLKYDSGMNRLGFTDAEFSTAITSLNNHKNVNELILMSHFASANLADNEFTVEQTKKFLQYRNNQKVSLSNSSALLNKEYLPDEWCRVGLALFGISPIESKTAADFNLKPVMKLKTNIIAIKEIKAGESVGYGQVFKAKATMKIAIIGIGYGDGYPWSLTKKAHVKIQNQPANIVGLVSMDMMAIDISHIPSANIGGSVLIWGKDQYSNLPIEKVAANANTIPYVLLCQITSRVHYKYVE